MRKARKCSRMNGGGHGFVDQQSPKLWAELSEAGADPTRASRAERPGPRRRRDALGSRWRAFGAADLGVHTTLAPTWFDPAETPGYITPYMILYALHDATVKPMPGQPMASCLAEWWSAAE